MKSDVAAARLPEIHGKAERNGSDEAFVSAHPGSEPAGVLPDGVFIDLSFDDDAASDRQTTVQLRREGNALQNKLTWNQVFTPNFNGFN